MADDIDPESLQASREWTRLRWSLGIRTPPRLQAVARLARKIRSSPQAKPKQKR